MRENETSAAAQKTGKRPPLASARSPWAAAAYVQPNLFTGVQLIEQQRACPLRPSQRPA
jgi:hypothetical protein